MKNENINKDRMESTTSYFSEEDENVREFGYGNRGRDDGYSRVIGEEIEWDNNAFYGKNN